MAETVRKTHGLAIVVIEPPRHWRIIDGIWNAVVVPMSWLELLRGSPPLERHHPPFRVVVRNRRGKQRTLALRREPAAALREQAEVVEAIETMGIDGWGEAMGARLPVSFLRKH